MCCIIHRLKDSKKIEQDYLEKIIKKNPHGWGVSYINDAGILTIDKSMEMKLLINKVRELEDENKEFLAHARFATQGDKTIENCHPFLYRDGAMFHNGRMDKIKIRDQKRTDSWHFTYKLSKFRKKGKTLDFLINEKYKDLIGNSRLAFMLKNGTIIKFGAWNTEDSWNELDGNFYSKLDWQRTSLYVAPVTSPYSSARNHSSHRVNPYDNLIDSVTNKDKKVNQTDISFGSDIETEIANALKEGNITDRHIEMLDVDELTGINKTFPEPMATYLYKLILREIS